jgi:hypothetical protein
VFKNRFFFIYLITGVELSPRGASATVWPLVPAPNDDDDDDDDDVDVKQSVE